MNRKHTAESYLKLIEKIRAARPDILLSGDFIVGFPGETEADFIDTMALIQAVNYGQAYSFKYSARPGTPAAERTEVDEQVKSERLARLQALLSKQQKQAQHDMIGRTVTVLFEKAGRLANQMIGKSEYFHAVHTDAKELRPGDLRQVKIVKSEANSLQGVLVTKPH